MCKHRVKASDVRAELVKYGAMLCVSVRTLWAGSFSSRRSSSKREVSASVWMAVESILSQSGEEA